MKLVNFKKFAAVSALGLVAVLGMSDVANAQGRGNGRNQQHKINKQQEKIERKNAKIEAQRIRLQQQQQAEWDRQNNHSGNDRSRGMGYYRGNANDNTARNGRYRVNRNGRYYNTDSRGAELLKQAVNAGYEQGYNAGQQDRSGRRRSSWTTSNVYRTGSYGYQPYVDRSQYQYYFQQGFQRGYQDGYDEQYRYGSNNGGRLSILGTILNQVLNIQSY